MKKHYAQRSLQLQGEFSQNKQNNSRKVAETQRKRRVLERVNNEFDLLKAFLCEFFAPLRLCVRFSFGLLLVRAGYLLSISAISGCAGPKMISTIDHPEVMAWGNLNGIRVEGQLMEFKTCLRVVQADWSEFNETTKERRSQRHRYARNGNTQTLSAILDSLFFTQVVEETGPGSATIAVQCSS